MVPWPIALIAALYAVFATASAAAWLRAVPHGSVLTLASGGVAALLMIGVALMRAWARRLAVWASAVWTLTSLAAALLAVLTSPPQPRYSLLATGMAIVQFALLRYLTRPQVKAWFASGVR